MLTSPARKASLSLLWASSQLRAVSSSTRHFSFVFYITNISLSPCTVIFDGLASLAYYVSLVYISTVRTLALQLQLSFVTDPGPITLLIFRHWLAAYIKVDSKPMQDLQGVDKHAYSLNLVAEPQNQSAFLLLPLEVRNHIYKDAFRGWSMIFTYGEIDIIARDRRYWNHRTTRPRGQRKGLPPWMRSCKQITTEALEVIASIWTFEGSSPTISKRPAEKTENDKPNPIVFHSNVMRNIAVRENLNTDSVDNKTVRVGRHLDIQEPIQTFLGLLKHLNVQNVCLELEWSRWWHRSDKSDPFWHAPEWVDNEPEIYTEDWNDLWVAKFRKVKIVINLSMDPSGGGAGADLVGVAESCA